MLEPRCELNALAGWRITNEEGVQNLKALGYVMGFAEMAIKSRTWNGKTRTGMLSSIACFSRFGGMMKGASCGERKGL